MSRPLRLEFEDALYHVTSRGDRREPIFEDDTDRETWLAVLEQGLERFEATAFAYCLRAIITMSCCRRIGPISRD